MRVTRVTSYTGKAMQSPKQVNFGNFADDKARAIARAILPECATWHFNILDKTNLVTIRSEGNNLMGAINNKDLPAKHIGLLDDKIDRSNLVNSQEDCKLEYLAEDIDRAQKAIYYEAHPEEYKKKREAEAKQDEIENQRYQEELRIRQTNSEIDHQFDIGMWN